MHRLNLLRTDTDNGATKTKKTGQRNEHQWGYYTKIRQVTDKGKHKWIHAHILEHKYWQTTHHRSIQWK